MSGFETFPTNSWGLAKLIFRSLHFFNLKLTWETANNLWRAILKVVESKLRNIVFFCALCCNWLPLINCLIFVGLKLVADLSILFSGTTKEMAGLTDRNCPIGKAEIALSMHFASFGLLRALLDDLPELCIWGRPAGQNFRPFFLLQLIFLDHSVRNTSTQTLLVTTTNLQSYWSVHHIRFRGGGVVVKVTFVEGLAECKPPRPRWSCCLDLAL